MKTFWAIAHDHNPGLFLASVFPGAGRWTRKAEEALPYASKDAALLVITGVLEGKGGAVLVSA